MTDSRVDFLNNFGSIPSRHGACCGQRPAARRETDRLARAGDVRPRKTIPLQVLDEFRSATPILVTSCGSDAMGNVYHIARLSLSRQLARAVTDVTVLTLEHAYGGTRGPFLLRSMPWAKEMYEVPVADDRRDEVPCEWCVAGAPVAHHLASLPHPCSAITANVAAAAPCQARGL